MCQSICKSSAPASTVDDRRTELDFGEGEQHLPSRGGKQQQQRVFQDPSEPIYTEPSLFERSRSLRSVAATDLRRVVQRSTADQQSAIKEVSTDTESAAL